MSLTDDDNSCFICWNPLTKEHGRKEIIHKYDKENKSSEKWQHSCHEKCLNTWIKQCITVGDGIYPKCPICNDFKIPINKIPKPLRERATEILEQEEEEEEEEVEVEPVIEEPNYIIKARQRLEHIRMDALQPDSINHPFMGIIISFNNRRILKTSNYLLNLGINSTIGDLKESISSLYKDIYSNSGIFSNILFNANPKNWINWSYPDYRVSDIHYGLPPYTRKFAFLENHAHIENDGCELSEIYRDYQSAVGEFLEKKDVNDPYFQDNQENYRLMDKVYNKQELVYNYPTGPDDPGSYDMAFTNQFNPETPAHMRPYEYATHSTFWSLAWLVVHVEQI